MTVDGVTSPFASLNINSVGIDYEITGPPATTVPLDTATSASTSGSNDGADLTEIENAGVGPTAGMVVAGQIGGSPVAVPSTWAHRPAAWTPARA